MMIQINFRQAALRKSRGQGQGHESSAQPGLKRLRQAVVSFLSLLGGLTLAVLIQAILGSVWDGF